MLPSFSTFATHPIFTGHVVTMWHGHQCARFNLKTTKRHPSPGLSNPLDITCPLNQLQRKAQGVKPREFITTVLDRGIFLFPGSALANNPECFGEIHLAGLLTKRYSQFKNSYFTPGATLLIASFKTIAAWFCINSLIYFKKFSSGLARQGMTCNTTKVELEIK